MLELHLFCLLFVCLAPTSTCLPTRLYVFREQRKCQRPLLSQLERNPTDSLHFVRQKPQACNFQQQVLTPELRAVRSRKRARLPFPRESRAKASLARLSRLLNIIHRAVA